MFFQRKIIQRTIHNLVDCFFLRALHSIFVFSIIYNLLAHVHYESLLPSLFSFYRPPPLCYEFILLGRSTVGYGWKSLKIWKGTKGQHIPQNFRIRFHKKDWVENMNISKFQLPKWIWMGAGFESWIFLWICKIQTSYSVFIWGQYTTTRIWI